MKRIPLMAVPLGLSGRVCLAGMCVISSLCSLGFATGQEGRTSPPNILFILADDLSWSDLGCYGHPWHETPNLDRLAGDGMRLTSAYAPAPICSASRAAILTGRTPARLGLEFVVKTIAGEQPLEPLPVLKPPPFTTDLSLEEITFAELLGESGYDTGFFGKWHLNAHYNGVYLGWSPTHGPGQQGFSTAEEDFGSHPYAGDYTLVENKSAGLVRDSLTDRAILFLEKERSAPFLLMVSHFYVHTPVKTRYPWLVEKYDRKVPVDVQNREDRITYAEFLEVMDYHIGQLLDALEESGLADSTAVVFLSDNGGHPQYTDNRPLHGSKWNLYEGGIRVPMIIRWPGRITPATVNDTVVAGTDILPTFLALADQPLGQRSGQLDGINVLPYLLGEASPPERAFYWHFPYYHPEGRLFGASDDASGHAVGRVSRTRPHSAIRQGRYKLLAFHENDTTELYDLVADPTESLDLSRSMPEVAVRLKQMLNAYLDSVDARMALRRESR